MQGPEPEDLFRKSLRPRRLPRYPAFLAPLCCALVLALAAPATAQQEAPASPQAEPEAGSGYDAKTRLVAERQLVVTANPLASETAIEILRAGGSATDAAIAALLVLGLVEPQSSGLGGGAFWLHYDAASGTIQAYDGRETAPASATPELFLDADGQPLGFWDAVASGRSVGVPGEVALLAKVHERNGRLPWAALFEPAIRLASEGFPLSERLHSLLLIDPLLRGDADANRYLYGERGNPLPVGTILTNPDYALILYLIARRGPSAFYEGPLAQAIVEAAARGEPTPPLALSDLADYEAIEREPVCLVYRVYEVCGHGPPSSGGVTLLQILGVLDLFTLGGEAMAASDLHLLAEASKLAFADRNAYLADPAFVEQPVAALLAPDYLLERARTISLQHTLEKAEPGLPKQEGRPPEGEEPPTTTHLVVADAWGNVVSVTASVENAFGSRRMVSLSGQGGFLLNNQLTDFAFKPVDADGQPVANRPEAGKRPRSSMAPTIVLDSEGKPAFALGTPGGSRIIGYVAQALVGLIDWRLDAAQAAALPHLIDRNTGKTDLELDRDLDELAAALEALGHEIQYVEMTSGLAILAVTPEGLTGGADPRREGIALGD